MQIEDVVDRPPMMEGEPPQIVPRPLFWLLMGLSLLLVVMWQIPSPQHLAEQLPLWLHIVTETLSIVVDMLIFGIAWHAYSTERPANIVILACLLLAVGLIDLAHTLSFPGMPDFITPASAEKALNFWLAVRAIGALALLYVAFHPWHPFRHPRHRYWLLAGTLTLTAAVYWLGLFHEALWSGTYQAGGELVWLKESSEYLLTAMLFLAAWGFYRRAALRHNHADIHLFAAAWLLLLSELSLTRISELTELLGHVYKFAAYIFIYHAVFVASVRAPYHRLHQLSNELVFNKLLLDAQGEASSDGIITVGEQGEILWYNSRFTEIWGISDAVMARHDAAQAMESVRDKVANYESFANKINDLYAHPQQRSWDEVVLNDGRVFDRYSAPLLRPDGSYLGRILTYRDITERKHAELRLRQSEEKMRLLFDSANDSVTLLTLDGTIIDINKYGYEHLGFGKEEMLGHRIGEFIAPQHAVLLHEHMTEAVEKGFLRYESTHLRKDGTMVPVEVDLRLIKLGGQMVLMKVARDISERKAAEQRIQDLAYSDPLTGLANRTLLRDRLGQLVAASHRDGKQFAVLFLDLDRFKYVNDSLGHSIGDMLLSHVAQRLRHEMREGDTIARIGGDEFILLLRDIAADGAAHVADKLLELLTEPFDLAGIQVSTHASIGIALYPDNAQDADGLIQYADAAMYRAKDQGRNQFQFFTPEMNFHAQKIFSMEKDLRLALTRGEFILYYQPQVELQSGKVSGMEVLLRWHHPQRGVIGPAEFIPVAEETGQIVELGSWVLREACHQLAQWHGEGLLSQAVMAVNLSVRQLAMANLVELVTDTLHETGLRPGQLELEVTEGLLMGDGPGGVERLLEISRSGVQLAIDDFGTGYSSLNYLKRLPVDKLKIDQSFVRDIGVDGNSEAIVRSIVSLGHQFSLLVIAEGVESTQQLEFLRQCGCDQIQGYYFSRPLAAEAFRRFILQRQA